mmetsp:Transcript_27829/g.78788  ORF Transcript_27829/g.78788 Transcript_27829/m.78788 type:complete len:674 (-) Transcript_27829:112-2133(-)
MALQTTSQQTRAVSPRAVSPRAHAPHSGIFLPAQKRTAAAWWKEIDTRSHGLYQPDEATRAVYDEKVSGGPQSFSDRTISLTLHASKECFSIGAKTSTTTREVIDLLAGWFQRNPQDLTFKRHTKNGAQSVTWTEECPSHVLVYGLDSLKRPVQQYEHPICIVGAGFGATQNLISLQDAGRTDLLMVEKHEDFGGHSWIKVANKFTKLQTERGTYHIDYIYPDAPVNKTVDGEPYPSWPSRNKILSHVREMARKYGLYKYTMFNTLVEKIKPTGKGGYVLQHVPFDDGAQDGGMSIVGAVIAWPGYLHDLNLVDFAGEDTFEEAGGYIEYSSFDRTDYDRTIGKTVILYGHGAFAIENVRTLVEHRCKKVYVVCRVRNLCGMKMISWLVGFLQRPIPGNVLVHGFAKIYDLVGFDPWSSFAVTTDANRTFANIQSKTIFGVTDVYFLAGYYGLMECVVDEIKRLTEGAAKTKKGKTIECEVIIKATGTAPSFKVDKQLGIKEMLGFWVNGDPLRPVSMGFKGVQAKNFGSFSVGPGFTPQIKQFNWFIDAPWDFEVLRDKLPTNKAGKWPAFVADVSYGLPVGVVVSMNCPLLAQETGRADGLKPMKQSLSHPLEEYLGECVKEWETYIKYFRKHNMVDERPDPPYPYTLEYMHDIIDKANRVQNGEKVNLFS